MKGLACLALDSELRSALVFDISLTALQDGASQLAAMLKILTGKDVDIVFLGSTENEDHLWGNWRLKRDRDRNRIDWQFNRLAQSSSHSHPRIILIPDLARISLATARACVTVTGADVANLQRHGQSLVWKPNLWWLAGCASAEIGEVSPHLLDRFALRLPGPQIPIFDRANDIQQWVEHSLSANQKSLKQIPDNISELSQQVKQIPDNISELSQQVEQIPDNINELLQQVKQLSDNISEQLQQVKQLSDTISEQLQAVKKLPDTISEQLQAVKKLPDTINEQLQKVKQLPLPQISSDLITQILLSFEQKSPGFRREITLARLSRSLAQLEGMSEVSVNHIQQAVNLIGLKVIINKPSTSDLPAEKFSQDNLSSEKKEENKSEWQPKDVEKRERKDMTKDDGEISLEEKSAIPPETEASFDVSSISIEPYPEDRASATREANSLQLPQQRYRSIRATEGPIIGTQPARDWEDIAILATVLEASKFQKVRSPLKKSDTSFRVTPADFRSYRRAPVPQQMFVAILDYTSLDGCDWSEAILPHLNWAYTIRASICIVQVGSAHAKNKYRAQQIKSHKLLSPNIYNALEEQPGIATPLAHGLDLAMRTLQSALQNGRNRIEQARLVVITDGRGNIPLAASRAGELTKPVSREGIEDAFTVAQELKKIKKVKTFLLNPQPQQYADLPIILGEILGATIQPISLWEG